MKCEKCHKPIIALEKKGNNKAPRQERCECDLSDPSTTGDNSPSAGALNLNDDNNNNNTSAAAAGSTNKSAKKKGNPAPVLLSTVNPDFWVGVQVRIQKAALGAKEEDVGVCTVLRSGNGWVQLQSKSGMVAKRAYNLELVGPPPTGPPPAPPSGSESGSTAAVPSEEPAPVQPSAAEPSVPVRRSVRPASGAVSADSASAAVGEEKPAEAHAGDEEAPKKATSKNKRKLPDEPDAADTGAEEEAADKDASSGLNDSFEQQGLSQQSVKPSAQPQAQAHQQVQAPAGDQNQSQTQTTQAHTGSQRISQRREKPVHDQYSDFYMGTDKELTRRTAATVSAARRPTQSQSQSEKPAAARPSSGSQAASSSHTSGGSKNAKKGSSSAAVASNVGDANSSSAGDGAGAVGALGGFTSNGPKINALLCEVKRSYVQKFVERYSEKIKGRPDLGLWLTKVKSRAIDSSFEKEIARKFPTGLCTYCNVEKWPGSDSCWNEWCIVSPIYWELPGARGEQPPTKPVGMLCATDLIPSLQDRQLTHTGSSSLLTSSDTTLLKSSSLLQIDTSGAFASTSLDPPLSSRNSGLGSGSNPHRDLSLALSPLARIGSTDDGVEPTPRRKARRQQDSARLGGKSPAAGSMSPGPLMKKRSFSLDGYLTYTPAVTSETLRYLTADELEYTACPYYPPDVSQYLVRAPVRLLPTQDPSVRPPEVYIDTDVDGSYSESKMD